MKSLEISMALLGIAFILFATSFAVKGMKATDLTKKEKNEKMAKNMKIAAAVLAGVGAVALGMHYKKSSAAGSTKFYYF